jgi:hypothetical protein
MKLLLQLCFALLLALRAGAADNLPGLVYQPDGDAIAITNGNCLDNRPLYCHERFSFVWIGQMPGLRGEVRIFRFGIERDGKRVMLHQFANLVMRYRLGRMEWECQDARFPGLTVSLVATTLADVHRMTYHTPSYALCSQWDHAPDFTSALYKEGRRHMLKWVSDNPGSTFAVYMENPFSPYFQHEGALIGVYAVPATFPCCNLYAPFTTGGAILKRVEKAGWVFCHNGSMLMGFYSVKPCSWGKKPWSGCDLLWCDARTFAWVLETSELKPFGGGIDAELNHFANAVLTKPRMDATGLDTPQPRLRYTALPGHMLELTWLPHKTPCAGQSKVDGVAINYQSWPLLSNQWVHQSVDRPVLSINYGKSRLTFDFAEWTREERVEQ